MKSPEHPTQSQESAAEQKPEEKKEGQKNIEDVRSRAISEIENERNNILQEDKRLQRNAASLDISDEEFSDRAEKFGLDDKLEKNKKEIYRVTKEGITQLRETEEGEGFNQESFERQEAIEQHQEEREGILRNYLVSEAGSSGLDLVPVAGSGKMIAESIKGETLDKEKLQGRDRVVHAGVGVASLGLDLTGAGAAIKSGILAGRSTALVGKMGARLAQKGFPKAARVFEKTEKFMKSHPGIVKQVERIADEKIKEGIDHIEDYRADKANGL